MATSDRVHQIKCPLPNDSKGECPLIFRQMHAKEELSRPFEYEVEMFSAQDDINPVNLLGKLMTVSVKMPSDTKTRYFNGIVSSFQYIGRAEGNSEYRAVLRPWIWLLSHNYDCRIFQEIETVPEIFEKICKDTHGFSDYRLSRSRELIQEARVLCSVPGKRLRLRESTARRRRHFLLLRLTKRTNTRWF